VKAVAHCLTEVLTSQAEIILDESAEALQRSNAQHYAREGSARERLARLLDLVTVSVEHRDLVPMIDYATRVANERFDAGFDLREVQCAFHALEEVIWDRVVASVPHTELAESLGLVGTVLGAGTDALARTYVSRASRQRVPSLDLSALFLGATDSTIVPVEDEQSELESDDNAPSVE
jgi:hypothetical protein